MQPTVPPVAIVGFIALLGSLFTLSPLLSTVAIITLLLAFKLLWRPGEAPIFLAILIYQWLQVNLKTFDAIVNQQPVSLYGAFGGDLPLAILLGNATLIALAVGLRLGAGAQQPELTRVAENQALHYPLRFWLTLYGVSWVVASLAKAGAWVVPGFTQIFLAISSLHWASFVIITYVAFKRSPHWRGWWFIFIIEFIFVIGGYFSGFQIVIICAMLGVSAALVPIRLRKSAPLLTLSVILILAAIVWTSVKASYRSYISGGQRAQIVVVDQADRFTHLFSLIMDFSLDDINPSYAKLVGRIAYVDLPARVLMFVPAIVPHGGGVIWTDAIVRVFTPRFLFSDKPPVHDSVRTNYYTGLGVASYEQGTSISIGYMAESYIDFGVPFMFLPIFGLGVLLGLFYRWLHNHPSTRGIWVMGLSTVALWPALLFETSITKMLPSFAVTMAVVVLVTLLLPGIMKLLSTQANHQTKTKFPTGRVLPRRPMK